MQCVHWCCPSTDLFIWIHIHTCLAPCVSPWYWTAFILLALHSLHLTKTNAPWTRTSSGSRCCLSLFHSLSLTLSSFITFPTHPAPPSVPTFAPPPSHLLSQTPSAAAPHCTLTQTPSHLRSSNTAPVWAESCSSSLVNTHFSSWGSVIVWPQNSFDNAVVTSVTQPMGKRKRDLSALQLRGRRQTVPASEFPFCGLYAFKIRAVSRFFTNRFSFANLTVCLYVGFRKIWVLQVTLFPPDNKST